jgi:hypothetical protein
MIFGRIYLDPFDLNFINKIRLSLSLIMFALCIKYNLFESACIQFNFYYYTLTILIHVNI